MYKTSNYTESYLPSDFPVTLDDSGDIYLKLVFDSSVDELKMVPQNCYATITPNKDAALRYYLIKDRYVVQLSH